MSHGKDVTRSNFKIYLFISTSYGFAQRVKHISYMKFRTSKFRIEKLAIRVNNIYQSTIRQIYIQPSLLTGLGHWTLYRWCCHRCHSGMSQSPEEGKTKNLLPKFNSSNIMGIFQTLLYMYIYVLTCFKQRPLTKFIC